MLEDRLVVLVGADEADFLLDRLVEGLVGDYPEPQFQIGQRVKLRGCAEHCRYGHVVEIVRDQGRQPTYKVNRGVAGTGEDTLRWPASSLEDPVWKPPNDL